MTDVTTNSIKEDFMTNKVERIFTGTLNPKHAQDFENNWKISKAKSGYEFQLSFVANNGKSNLITIPFSENTPANSARAYTFANLNLTKSIDGIVYDIIVTNINNVPNIKMQENIKETLSEAEKNTKIKLESDIFSGKKEKRENNGNTYNVENLGLSQGPIALDKEHPGGYKLIHVDMKAKENSEEIDFTKSKNEVEITQAQETANGTEKHIFLAPTIKGKTLTLNLVEPEDLKKEHWETPDKYKERLREEKALIFVNLRNLSSTLNSKLFLLPTSETDESKYINPIVGPDNNGVYKYKLVNKKEDTEEQNIYLQVQGTEIKLCNSDGKKTLDKAFLKEPISKDYYTLSIDKKQLSAKKIDKDQQEKIPAIFNPTINYLSQKVSIDIPKDKVILLN